VPCGPEEAGKCTAYIARANNADPHVRTFRRCAGEPAIGS
jgi:hypothetical protein